MKKAEFSKTGKDQILLTFYADSDCRLEEWSILQNRQTFCMSFEKELNVNGIASNESAVLAATGKNNE